MATTTLYFTSRYTFCTRSPQKFVIKKKTETAASGADASSSPPQPKTIEHSKQALGTPLSCY